jgi:outer membrane protein assembly factor BamB
MKIMENIIFIVLFFCLWTLAIFGMSQEEVMTEVDIEAMSTEVEGPDWPQWRGPERDNIAREDSLDLSSITEEPEIIWHINIGKGFSNVVIVGNYLFTMGNNQNKDTVYCMNADTGEIAWTYTYDCWQGSHPGPRSTPFIEGDRIYTLSREGHLFCFDLYTGNVIWQKDLHEEFNASPPTWGFAGSPVIEDDLLILNVLNNGLALNKQTGEVIWQSGRERPGYSTPVIFSLEGRKMAALFGSKALNIVDIQTGELLDSYGWKTGYDVNAADPLIIEGNKIFISSNYNKGCAFFEMSENGLTLLWENKNVASHFSGFILKDGFIYGNSGDANDHSGFFFCLNPDNGEILWSTDYGVGSVTAVNDILILLNENGRIYFARMEPEQYTEIAYIKMPFNVFWSPPVFNRGKLYIKSNFTGDLYCISLN